MHNQPAIAFDHQPNTRIRRLSRDLPDEVEVGQIDLAGGRRIVDCTDFHTPGRNDLLLATRDGMTAETLDGKHLWTLPEKLGEVVFSADAVDGRRLLFALAGKRAEGKGHGCTTTGKPNPSVVQDQLLAVDGASGAVLKRTRLPVSPREDLLRHYDLGYETGSLSGGPATDFVVREWRSDWGGGGEMIWAFDAALNLLWERKVHPGYGHHIRFASTVLKRKNCSRERRLPRCPSASEVHLQDRHLDRLLTIE